MTRGRFITFEGGEGVGKSTNLAFAQDFIHARGHRAFVTREPGGTLLGEEIRAILLAHRQDEMSDNAELLLMFAARAQHLESVILPALEQGVWVLCDRFTDASYAYQGGGRGMDDRRIAVLEDWVQEAFRPDLTLLLDAPVDVGLSRAGRRGHLDRFESEAVDFFQRVRSKYLDLADQHPHRIKIVDAARPLDLVQRDIAAHIEGLMAP